MLGKPEYVCINNYLYNISWRILSMNINAIPILEENLDKVNWLILSRNEHAIHILEKNLDANNKLKK